MSRERILIAIAAFAVLLVVLAVDWSFDTWLASLALIVLLGGLAQAEAYSLLGRMGLDSHPSVGVAGAVLLLLARGLLPLAGLDPAEARAATLVLFVAIVVSPLVLSIFRAVGEREAGREEMGRAAVTAFGLLLVWFLLSFLLELRLLPDTGRVSHQGLKLALVLVLSAKLGDSAAYVVGRAMGRTRMTWVSPGKTWEGALASVLAGGGASLGIGAALGFPWWQMLLLGLIANPAGQLGDVLESLLKRRAGMKDSGTLLKEMGGFLDVLDSVLLAAPVGYLFVRLLVLP